MGVSSLNVLTFRKLMHRVSERGFTRLKGIVVNHNNPRAYCVSSNGDFETYDVAFVGAGIVGMATAREVMLRHPYLKCSVIDKESIVAGHQSGHNSGVIHAGIYYTPGSLKAHLCVQGLKQLYQYCDEHKVPYKRCGKLIVATTPEEISRLDNLHERGLKNEVPGLEVVGPEKIMEIEPHCRGLKALYSPNTGIIDYGLVTRTYADNFQSLGGTLLLSRKVESFTENRENPDYPVSIVTSSSNSLFKEKRVNAKHVVVCGGLHADKLAEKSGCKPTPKIVPFRGDYLQLKPEKRHLIRGNIYPVPNPKFPFLGVHFTPRMNGDIWLGPNAVLAFKREGYKLLDISVPDLADALAFSGLRKLVYRNVGYALGEFYRGVSISAFTKQLQRFVPELTPNDVMKGPSGVRAQALDSTGNLVDDFVFDSGEGSLGKRIIHVRNAPSPAATSSLAIAKMVADKAEEQFGL